MLTRAKLVLIDSGVALSHLDIDGICTALQAAFDNVVYGFNTVNRQAAFIGQLCVESAHFQRVTENLNYSAQGLLNTFPTHFSGLVDANAYAHDPHRIANRVYANRMGNGDEASGDGWKFRGRGLIQLTGHDNYAAFSHAADPDYLATPAGAVNSAVWFYAVKHNLNLLADKNDITGITKIINGGTHGLSDRIAFYNKALIVLPT